jgi:hypothetical protein
MATEATGGDALVQSARQAAPRTEEELRDWLDWSGREALRHFPAVQAAFLDAVDELVALRAALAEAHTLLHELRRVVWAGQFGIPAEETWRLQRAIDAVAPRRARE